MALEKMAIMTHLEKSVKSDGDDNGRFAKHGRLLFGIHLMD